MTAEVDESGATQVTFTLVDDSTSAETLVGGSVCARAPGVRTSSDATIATAAASARRRKRRLIAGPRGGVLSDEDRRTAATGRS